METDDYRSYVIIDPLVFALANRRRSHVIATMFCSHFIYIHVCEHLKCLICLMK